MATTFTGLSEAKIDDVIVMAIRSILPYLGSFSTQLQHPEGLVKGNSYTVPVDGAATVADKTPGVLVSASGSLSGVPVLVDKFKGASFEALEGSVDVRVIEAWWTKKIMSTAAVVAQSVVDSALALVTAANYGATAADVVTDADFDRDTVKAIRTAARKKLKNVGGAFICGPDVASSLIDMQQVVIAISEGRNALRDGRIPGQLLGYDAIEYVGFPANGENLVAAVVGQSAIAVAAGAPQQLITSGEGEVAYRRIVEEPETGLSLQYTEAVEAGGRRVAELALLFGVKKAQDAVVRLVTA